MYADISNFSIQHSGSNAAVTKAGNDERNEQAWQTNKCKISLQIDLNMKQMCQYSQFMTVKQHNIF
ncbi:hypothetical protein B9T34_07690 [Acinetobacter sp. ANC 3813]|nr:hypothetical protein B9T34_07690 [Acinetobacter sp. ANC 3813]